ncbi:MAG TPA: ferritin family protein [Prolixibacteraceae bacterium]|nr:ferritin family protein [Prolixibacteraceae bacterium]
MKNIFFIALISLFALTGCNRPFPAKTIENLKAGIIGETTASAKYAAFAEKAKEEGYANISTLFEAASKAESIHAANHLKVLEGLDIKMEEFTPAFEVKSTEENLQAAIDGESYEVTDMYPQFLADAKTEKVDKAEKSFSWAFDTEKKHLAFYAKALEAYQSAAENTLPVAYAVCPVCGNTYDATMVDDKCAFCQTSKEKFIMF